MSRDETWPLTPREAEFIRSLDLVFQTSMGLALALGRKSEKDSPHGGREFLKKSLAEWEKSISDHCERFMIDRDLVRELLGDYVTVGTERVRLFREDRKKRSAKEKS